MDLIRIMSITTLMRCNQILMLMPNGNMILHPTGPCLQISSTDMYITVWMVLTIIQLCLLIASSISSIQKQASPIAGMDGKAISARSEERRVGKEFCMCSSMIDRYESE